MRIVGLTKIGGELRPIKAHIITQWWGSSVDSPFLLSSLLFHMLGFQKRWHLF